MRSLLVHNSKVPEITVKAFSANVKIIPSNEDLTSEAFDYDIYYDSQLDLILSKDNFEIIYISLSLSNQDYLEMNGLRIANHIRLSPAWGHQFVPIVILAQEDINQIIKLNKLGLILLTKGTYLSKELLFETIDKKAGLDEKDFQIYLSYSQIEPPSNYLSHHSIANEWALNRYFSIVKPDLKNARFIRLKDKIAELNYFKSLHFKFNEARATRQKIGDKKKFTPSIKNIANKKIGVIDDEIDKGWAEFYDLIIDYGNGQSIPYTKFKKGDTKLQMIARIQEWVSDVVCSDDPIETFIIDLRLHDDDFQEGDFDQLSGILIVKFIKALNPGIQIVISTASNKVWNFQQCLKYSVHHFAVKESPDTFNSREDTRNAINHLCAEISRATGKCFLASLYNDIQTLKKNNMLLNSSEAKEFHQLTFERNGLLDQIFALLVLDSSNQAVINQCLLIAFQVLENYCDLAIVGSFGKNKADSSSSGFIWLKDNTKKNVYLSKPGEELSIFELVYGNFDFHIDITKTSPKSFKDNIDLKLVLFKARGIETTTIIQLISVLYYRESLSLVDIEQMLKLRAYRSNVAAHFTGEIDIDIFKIGEKDIFCMIDIFKKIFLKRTSV